MQQEPLSQLLSHAKRCGATDADALRLQSEEWSLNWRLGALENLQSAQSDAVGLRVFVGNRIASSSTTDLSPDALKLLAERTVEMAKAAPEDPFARLTEPKDFISNHPDLMLEDPDPLTEAQLTDYAREAENHARAVPGVTNSQGAGVGHTRSHVWLATSKGFAGHYRTRSTGVSITVLAGEGTGMERDYAYASRRFAADLPTAEALGWEAAERATTRVHPRKAPSCQVPVVFESRIAKSLLSAFASAISGAAVARGTSFLKDAMGTELFAPSITLYDDPWLPKGLGSRPFDGEGMGGKRRAIVENGVLTSWFLDQRSAAQLGMRSTGHASRGLASPPSPSPTNFWMEPGTLPPQELLADIASGFYVTDLMGMGVNQVTGDYSQGAAGFWIENGQLAYPVSEITIAGNLKTMFRNLTPANDLAFDARTNSPTLRIEGMTIAGA
jgi:PmbA protein